MYHQFDTFLPFYHQETAINIGYSSSLFDDNMDVIVVNASSLVSSDVGLCRYTHIHVLVYTVYMYMYIHEAYTSNNHVYLSPMHFLPHHSLLHVHVLLHSLQEATREILLSRKQELDTQGVEEGSTHSWDSVFSSRPLTCRREQCRKKEGSVAKGLVIDGGTLQFALQPSLKLLFLDVAKCCDAVICSRTTPIQKVGSSCIAAISGLEINGACKEDDRQVKLPF